MGLRRSVGISGSLSRILLGVVALGTLALSGAHSARTTEERNLAGPDCIHVSCTEGAVAAKRLPIASQPTPTQVDDQPGNADVDPDVDPGWML